MALTTTSNLRGGDKQASSSYDEYIDLRGYGKAEQSAIDTFTKLSNVDNIAADWLSAQLSRGAKIVGTAIINAAGDIIGSVAKGAGGKIVEVIDMAKTKRGKTNAPVSKVQPRKGVNRQQAMSVQPVFTQPPGARAPVNISKRVMVKTKPKMTAGSKGLLITHREMIGQIISSGTTLGYSTDSFVINPGKYGTFPWLSNIACNFDKYVMKRLRFYTISNQSTSIAGRVGLGFDVDSTDPQPADRNEFFSLTYHSECAPWDSVILDIPVDGKERFINSHTSTDSKLIDIGQIILMSDAIAATSVALSDVIVEYTVELIDPQQAVYSTQAILGNNSSVATLDLLPTFGPNVVTMSGSDFAFRSTSTILYLKVLQGYYHVSVIAVDDQGGTPGVSLAMTGGTGRASGAGTTIVRLVDGIAKVNTNDGYFRITTTGVTVPNLESCLVLVSRISATVYVKCLAGPVYDSAITLF